MSYKRGHSLRCPLTASGVIHIPYLISFPLLFFEKTFFFILLLSFSLYFLKPLPLCLFSSRLLILLFFSFPPSAISSRFHRFKGFYTGYMTTVAREIPFSFIQFPMWERMKKEWAIHQGTPLAAWQGALCGSISGAISAAATTPLDVCKTRLMIDTAGKYSGMIGTMYVQALHTHSCFAFSIVCGKLWSSNIHSAEPMKSKCPF